ncbi:histidine kinase [Caballeronia novacaledonica]|uniref:histidine kinase n=1 Tax=Caballeronia novacaledonica TaxID=1544861 RepID=A0A2U3IDK2_9BURK|nr:GAF domain-containing sensor histidine kinase [Caballeronia novacaledonica]SPB18202.1 histidine kinase [Caballeronia novacaledonica]
MENIANAVDSSEALARDVGAVARIGAVPSMLQMICEETGMGFAAVARVTDATWTACAVLDKVEFGLKPGGQLQLHTTLCFESRVARMAIVIDDFSESEKYREHHTPAIYGLKSYISVPIVLPSGEYFGNLCAIDTRAATVSDPKIVRMFEVFANLIGMQLDSEQRQWSTESQLTQERETATLREQFIAVLGHDLRSPLAAVSATAELLSRREAEPDVAAIGHRLKRSALRMARLIDDVMDFARGRMGSGMTVALKEETDLGVYLRAVVDEHCMAYPSRTVNCSIVVDASARCDLARLQQLMSNLLANALTHGSPDAPVVVSAVVESRTLLLSVSNAGEPIPSRLLARVFEPYWRPKSSEPGGGLGLGLYICKQIVEAHAGTLEVSSSAKDGTRFTARIPL